MSLNANGMNTAQTPYLITSRDFPVSVPEDLEQVLSKSWVDTSQAINTRTIGIFNTTSQVNGDKYYNNSNPLQLRQAYRKTFAFGAIAAGATLLIPHGVSGIIEIVHLYGNCITDASVLLTAKYEPIPFVSAANINQQVALYADDTNITVINGAGNNNILSGNIVLEYLLN